MLSIIECLEFLIIFRSQSSAGTIEDSKKISNIDNRCKVVKIAWSIIFALLLSQP